MDRVIELSGHLSCIQYKSWSRLLNFALVNPKYIICTMQWNIRMKDLSVLVPLNIFSKSFKTWDFSFENSCYDRRCRNFGMQCKQGLNLIEIYIARSCTLPWFTALLYSNNFEHNAQRSGEASRLDACQMAKVKLNPKFFIKPKT